MTWETPDMEPDDASEEETSESLDDEAGELEAGWYTFGVNGLRFYDGEDWTSHYAPAPAKSLNMSETILAVTAGVLIGWFLIYIGSQISPEHIYFPVKFVVKELPQAFR